MREKLTHFDEKGNAVMVDVSEKEVTSRVAVASGKIRVNAKVMEAVKKGTSKKGDVLGVARVAGIMAVKQTANLIPMCHTLLISKCEIAYEISEDTLEILARCTVKVEGKTGVEMEALTGVSVTLLTIYDMCKAIDRTMELSEIHLEEKKGGKSGHFRRENNMRVAIITASTLGYKGEREDKSGPYIKKVVENAGFEVKVMKVLPDDRRILGEVMKRLADSNIVDLIITTGGTGFSESDVTPEATLYIVERQVPGIPEAMRAYSMQFTKRAMLSRAAAGIRKQTLIVNFPGSPKSLKESLEYILPELIHGVEILQGIAKECAAPKEA